MATARFIPSELTPAEVSARTAVLDAIAARPPQPTTLDPTVLDALRQTAASQARPLHSRATTTYFGTPPLPLRRIAPAQGSARGTLLHVHGGGWCLKSEATQDALLAHLADESGLCVVSLGYRLAPEHPFPAAVDDCVAALLLAASAGGAAAFSGPLVALAGDSAGAGLVLCALLRLRRERPDAYRAVAGSLRALLLAYGCYDLALAPSARLQDPRDTLSRPFLEALVRAYAGADPALVAQPACSPVYERVADLCGLPPAFFLVGSNDLLLDDSLIMAGRWAAAGNDCALHIVQHATHGFLAFPFAGATKEGLDAMCGFLNERLLGL